MRRGIQSGEFAANAALTQAIKGSAKPLVDGGTFFQAITSMIVDEFTVFVGVMRTAGETFNVAVSLAEGTQVNVTPRMRGMFKALWLASQNTEGITLTGRAAELFARKSTGWFPISEGKSVIVIPARDWVTAGFADASLKRLVKGNWSRALKKVMKKRARGR
jgi:hypothetical protein